ncbi:hypothetical protein RvY_07536 [Ramazzottius varieornatus]|uniref:Uncharacterized protein n=1 Tax=Ramazzottius varieornatus TaxID=947166 RepID=A0A1D1VAZ1_RAMVA|nr:hypothetical protein RvY_07536 [Ramazzottius varieornatus]
MADILDVMSHGFTELLMPPANLTPDKISQIMSLFTETIVYNSNLFRYVLTQDVVPIYKTSKIKILLPNESLLSSNGVLPLAEAVPEKELVKTAAAALPNTLPDGSTQAADQVSRVAIQNHINGVGALLNEALNLSTAHEQNASSGVFPDQVPRLSDAEVQAAIQRVAKAKFAEFQREVDEAVMRREHIVAEYEKK